LPLAQIQALNKAAIRLLRHNRHKTHIRRVSRYGLISYASSLDQIGVLGKSAEDCAIMLNSICGHDPRDTTSANIEKT
jgi:Asp-tRNA(Asn)/Glu-tRNA(Gln) amidotransferase A subunit family amidase